MDVDVDIELHDSEIPIIEEIGRKLHDKYSSRSATRANLLSLVHEAEDLFRQAGFEIVIGLPRHLYREVFGLDIEDHDGTLPEHFEIRIVRRLTPFDPERQRHDVLKGVAEPFWERQRERQKRS